MTVRRLTEGTVNLIYDYIQANLPAALDAVNADTTVLNTVPHVSIENIKSFFVYPEAEGYTPPVCFIMVDEFNFNIRENNSNFVNATAKVDVSIVVEDQDTQALTYKCWRYQSALHSVLDLATMVSSDNKLVLKSVVYRATFSPVYMNKGDIGGFRKEVLFKLEVEHLESF